MRTRTSAGRCPGHGKDDAKYCSWVPIERVRAVCVMWYSRSNSNPGQPGQTVRYILIDTGGPVAEFATWEEASQFLRENRGQGSIVRSEQPTNPWPEGAWPDAVEPDGHRQIGTAR